MIYDADGTQLLNAYDANGNTLGYAYDADGNIVYVRGEPIHPSVDYTNYSFTQKWSSKGITSQDFAIHDDKVFWASKSGNDSVPATCYILNLSDGSQIQTTTIYSGHANSMSFDYPKLYASTGYSNDKVVYINSIASDYSATLTQTLKITDESVAIDACIDESDSTILWTHGKTASSAEMDIISKWDLTDLADNGDGTYSPALIYSMPTPKPETIFSQSTMYFQGCTFHDGLLWYPTWYNGVVGRIVAVNPSDGEVAYIISTETTTEVEGIEFYSDQSAVGGYAMYMGFQGMMMRKYTFGALQ